MQQANENGIAHIVIRETLGAVAHFACGRWNYWAHLKHGGGQPCAACARQIAEMRKRERDARRMRFVAETGGGGKQWLTR